MPDLASLLVFPFMLVFFRVGGAFLTYPAISDLAINQRTRLLLAFFVTLAMFPILDDKLPLMPESTSMFLMLTITEVAIGIIMAIGARMFMAVMHVAGELISFTAGLQAASLFDPRSGASTSAPGLFLGMIASLLVFTLGIHYLLIEGIALSYDAFPPGNLPNLGDTASALTNVMSNLFVIGVKIAAPVMAIGFLGYAAFGIFNRMIPSLQVFFVALPITIVVGIFILGVTLASMIMLFSNELVEHAILFNQTENRF